MTYIHWVGGAAMAAGVWLYGSYTDNLETKAALVDYQFSETDLARFGVCKGAMRKYGLEFEENNPASGCACIVAGVKDQVQERQRDAAHELDALDSWASGSSVASPELYSTKAEAIRVKYDLSDPQMTRLSGTVDGIVETCSAG
jgi:hypothetical protein